MELASAPILLAESLRGGCELEPVALAGDHADRDAHGAQCALHAHGVLAFARPPEAAAAAAAAATAAAVASATAVGASSVVLESRQFARSALWPLLLLVLVRVRLRVRLRAAAGRESCVAHCAHRLR